MVGALKTHSLRYQPSGSWQNASFYRWPGRNALSRAGPASPSSKPDATTPASIRRPEPTKLRANLVFEQADARQLERAWARRKATRTLRCSAQRLVRKADDVLSSSASLMDDHLIEEQARPFCAKGRSDRSANYPPNCPPTSVLLVLKLKFYTKLFALYSRR